MFGWSLSGDSFAVILLLASVVNVVSGEKLLTTGKEELPDGRKEWTTEVHVDEYNQLDQCMSQPGHQEIYHHAIAFQLLPDQMNSGTGLIICYSGQLDRRNHDKGIVADILHRVNNVRGNELGDRCESARQELKSQCEGKTSLAEQEQCEHFVEYPWHALQLVEDTTGGNIIVHLSTTDQSYSISREKFNKYTGRLFLKLANWEELRSNFSRHIGPGPWPSDFCVENDCAQYRFYTDNAEYGSLLRHYMGIWSIGLDVLPKDPMATELDFYVIRSKCSEMAVSVLQPSESSVTKLPNPALKRNIIQSVNVERMIFENSTLILQGQVEAHVDHMQLVLNSYDPLPILECGSEDSSESKLKGLILDFNFTTGMTTLEAIGTKGSHGTSTSQNLLHPGQNFLIEAVALAQSVEVSINCGPNVTFPVNETLPFNRPLQFTVIGADIYKMQYIGAEHAVTLQKNWLLKKDGNSIGDGRGILLAAKMMANWKKLQFTFIGNDNQPLLLFKGNNQEQNVEIKWAQIIQNCTSESINVIPIDKSCGCFELYIELQNQNIKIVLNGETIRFADPIFEFLEDIYLEQPAEITSVKLVVNQTTWTVLKAGRFFELKRSVEKGDVIKVSGRFFRKATFLTIALVYFKNYNEETAEECMNDDTDHECSIDLDIHVDMRQNSMALRKQFKSFDMKKHWSDEVQRNFTESEMQFMAGLNFELKTLATVSEEKNAKNKTVENRKYIVQGMEPFQRNDDFEPNVIWVSMDDGVLFDDPKI